MPPHDSTSRRGFLAAGLALPAAAAPAPPLPTVRFGSHDVTRLIIGSNPFYGFTHFNKIYDSLVAEYYTQDRRMEVLSRCERAGINTWQFHYSPPSIPDFDRFRSSGGKLQWFLLSDGAMCTDFSLIPPVAKRKPIGIAHHGNRTDDRFRDKQMDKVRDFCKAVRDNGVMVGVSTHNPEVVDFIESAGWDIDYYMTCLYRVSRTKEEARAAFGEAPVGEIYMEKDPERMTRAVRATRRPCLAFKIFGAGRTVQNRAQVEQSFRFALSNIKPGDALIVGMFPKFKDEITENVEIVRGLTRTPS
jgi:hypothetical protein